MTIGYLTSQFPAPSHVFIARELTELLEEGFPINTYSIRRPPPGYQDGIFEAMTTYLQPIDRALYAREHLNALCKNPRNYVNTFVKALKHRAPGALNLGKSIAHFAEAIVLAAYLKRDGVTHLHNHFANSGATIGYLATQYLGITWSLTLHAHSETDYPSGYTLGEKIKASKFAMCISNFGRAQFMRTVPDSEWGKLIMYRCGVPQQDQPVFTNNKTFTWVCVARLSEEKGISGLLKAFQDVHGSKLVLVGDGPERKHLESLVENNPKLKGRVEFRGALRSEQTMAEIKAADALVLSSLMEGLPVVLMEAMSLGKPVVAPNLAGIPDLVVHKHNGYLFEPSNWVSLAQQMLTLQISPRLNRAEMGRAGYLTIQERFIIEKAVRPLAKMFIKLGLHPELSAIELRSGFSKVG